MFHFRKCLPLVYYCFIICLGLGMSCGMDCKARQSWSFFSLTSLYILFILQCHFSMTTACIIFICYFYNASTRSLQGPIVPVAILIWTPIPNPNSLLSKQTKKRVHMTLNQPQQCHGLHCDLCGSASSDLIVIVLNFLIFSSHR